VLGRRGARDAQFTRGEVLDQERQEPALLAHPGTAPAYLRAVRKPTPAVVGTIDAEAERFQPPYIGPQIVGGHAVVYEALARQEPSPAPDVIPGIFRVQERDQLEVRSIPEGYKRVARQAVGVLTAGLEGAGSDKSTGPASLRMVESQGSERE